MSRPPCCNSRLRYSRLARFALASSCGRWRLDGGAPRRGYLRGPPSRTTYSPPRPPSPTSCLVRAALPCTPSAHTRRSGSRARAGSPPRLACAAPPARDRRACDNPVLPGGPHDIRHPLDVHLRHRASVVRLHLHLLLRIAPAALAARPRLRAGAASRSAYPPFYLVCSSSRIRALIRARVHVRTHDRIHTNPTSSSQDRVTAMGAAAAAYAAVQPAAERARDSARGRLALVWSEGLGGVFSRAMGWVGQGRDARSSQ